MPRADIYTALRHAYERRDADNTPLPHYTHDAASAIALRQAALPYYEMPLPETAVFIEEPRHVIYLRHTRPHMPRLRLRVFAAMTRAAGSRPYAMLR